MAQEFREIKIKKEAFVELSKIASISGKTPEEAIESIVKELYLDLREDGVLI